MSSLQKNVGMAVLDGSVPPHTLCVHVHREREGLEERVRGVRGGVRGGGGKGGGGGGRGGGGGGGRVVRG